MMDELERRLSSLLTKVGERADPAAARLRNPAESPRRDLVRFGSRRLHTAWRTAAVAATVVGVVAGVTAGIPKLTGDAESGAAAKPSPSAGRSQGTSPAQSQGTSDGVHPLWPLAVSQSPSLKFDQLSVGGRVDLPVPHTVDPRLVPELTTVPTLVTASGKVRFTGADTTGVHLLAQRRQGVFVAVTGTGRDGADGLYNVRFVLVAPDNTRHEFHRVPQASSVAVSPDGTKLAVSTWLGGSRQHSEPAVELIDVGSGKVEHRLPGSFTQVAWASDRAIVLSGPPDQATSLAWRAPWTGSGEQIGVRSGSAMTVDGGMVALDATRGCLQRLDADATVTAANCGTWRSVGNASPDGRYASLEWSSEDGTVRRGVLDVTQSQVRPWPVEGMNPSWLGPADVLLTQADVQDSPAQARCDLTTTTCVKATDDIGQGIWRGADWIGSS